MYIFSKFSFLPDTTVWLTAGHSARSQANFTKITRNQLIRQLDEPRTVPAVNQTSYLAEAGNALLLTRASMGKSNFYDKMRLIKVNYYLIKMLSGMEIIENLIENFTENRNGWKLVFINLPFHVSI